MIRASLLVVILWTLLISPAQANFNRLENQLSDYIPTDEGTVGIYFIDLYSNQTIEINAQHIFNPASLIKVPLMMVMYDLMEKHMIDEKTKLTLHKKHIVGGAGILQHHEIGSAYAIKECMEYMIKYSDNTATKMIIDFIGKSKINEKFNKWGQIYTQIVESNLILPNKNKITPLEMGELYRQILTWGNNQSKQQMLLSLKNQKYKSGIPRYIPKTIQIANKTGTLNKVKHDCGVVFLHGKTYILCILTEGIETVAAEKLIASLSKVIFDYQNSNTKNKDESKMTAVHSN